MNDKVTGNEEPKQAEKFKKVMMKQDIVLTDEVQRHSETKAEMKIKMEELNDECYAAPQLMEQYLVESDLDDPLQCTPNFQNTQESLLNGHSRLCDVLSVKKECISHKTLEKMSEGALHDVDLCELCQKPPSSNFIGHRIEHMEDKIFSCEVCHKKFTRASNLRRHRRIHTGEKPFGCDLCEKRFVDSSDLTRHKLIHTGQKPFTCEFCKKNFSRSSNLAMHRKNHTGERPFSCDVCSKSFTNLSHLIQHEKIHSGEKPFSCDICSKAFATNSHLVKHKRTHTGEKPFSCDVCQKTFTTSTHLVQHKRIHTGERPFSCRVCHMSFSSSSSLNRHKRTHYGKNDECGKTNKVYFCEDKSSSEVEEETFPCEMVEVHVKEKTREDNSSEDEEEKNLSKPKCSQDKYLCEFCQGTFSRAAGLVLHKKMAICQRLLDIT